MRTFDDVMDHDKALTVSCQECKSPIGKPCTRVNLKGERTDLVNFPAHRSRIKRAERIKRLQELDAERSKTFQADRTPSGTVSIAPDGDQAVGIDTEVRGR
ncbi:hypothetical protein SEA_WHACK_65 [Rhodococcus phage Whack]|uniref:DNA-binding phage zinc finger domain-containing protein n=1 Tax=Rhodococcus phage Whack TaxID=2591132 RepID=A0A515MKD3_9CAUD|nr:hypothetical protein HWC40_gp65 [Rhodococcus phage Whack]QDM57128.1 hypothetical protein SEA_WHACK_65 [Rhodococcus phage Whack]